MKREFLMLAHVYDEKKISPAGWFVSTKMDGVRCFWDGGISRSIPTDDVPYANVEKDKRYVEQQVATGLWTRYGKAIQAPAVFLDKLPIGLMLDGELYYGRGTFQKLVSTVKTLNPVESAWENVQYRVFDSPPVVMVFGDGVINNTNFKKIFKHCVSWVNERGGYIIPPREFEATYNRLYTHLPRNESVMLHEQTILPFNTDAAKMMLMNMLEAETEAGGEGLMIRRGASYWVPGRSHDLLKIKKMNDAEGIVVGYTAGKETALGSKLLGLMGSLRLQLPDGQCFDLSGFTDAEREMTMLDGRPACGYLSGIPGQTVDIVICQNDRFPVGATVTFLYREMTNDGLPKEARYFRTI